MADLAITTEHLETLATKHDDVTAGAESATIAAPDIKGQVDMSHGVASVWSNNAFGEAEKARKEVCEALQQYTADLALKLRTAAKVYANTDTETSSNIAKQVLAG